MRRKLRPLAVLAMVALIGAGCSNVSAENGNGGNKSATDRDKAVKFAECVRENGAREFPDPDASGKFAYGIKLGSSLDPSSAAWKKAIGACKDLQPPGWMGNGKQTAKSREARLKFAACMRENGVKDFPDPAGNGPLVNVRNAQSKPGFTAAMQKCRDLLPGGLGGR
ncbi:hypothetical protein [Streptosporangium sp. NPDC000396]|uniref:hypothetical protein n=1 Tax=Streptosporangium sp. NPDC000396 TaxID=3366185 RepID=UPI00368387A5